MELIPTFVVSFYQKLHCAVSDKFVIFNDDDKIDYFYQLVKKLLLHALNSQFS